MKLYLGSVVRLCGIRFQGTSCTFTLQQEVSPEADDGRLPVQRRLLLGEVDGEEPTDRLSRESICRFAENTAERRREELHLDQIRGRSL